MPHELILRRMDCFPVILGHEILNWRSFESDIIFGFLLYDRNWVVLPGKVSDCLSLQETIRGSFTANLRNQQKLRLLEKNSIASNRC